MTVKKILLLEDDPNLGFMLQENLELRGYEVKLCTNGVEGMSAFNAGRFDLCLVDVMMPKKDGFTFAREVRERDQQTPLIFLTAKSLKEDRIEGLKIGADDYITKPFSPRALVARVRALLRRTRGEIKLPSIIRIGALEIDAEKYSVTFNGKPIKLTPNEFKLLQLLASRPGQTLTREQLLNDMYGIASSFDRSIDSHIKNLRKKLETASGQSMIETVYGIGYRFMENK